MSISNWSLNFRMSYDMFPPGTPEWPGKSVDVVLVTRLYLIPYKVSAGMMEEE